jgi:hypothetical protein
MKRIAYHLILPAVLPVLFFIVVLTPVEVLGCFLRGLIALLISLVSGLAALAAAIIGTRGRRTKGVTKGRAQYDKNSIWWVLSTLILVIPVVAMIILA